MLGQGIRPAHYHYMTKGMSDQDLMTFLNTLRGSIRHTLERLPQHQDFLDEYCKATSDIWATQKPAVA
jgi:tryptophan halogenase